MQKHNILIIEEPTNIDQHPPLLSITDGHYIWTDLPLNFTVNPWVMKHIDANTACRLGFWAGVEFEQRTIRKGS